jgi:hypothetical protein
LISTAGISFLRIIPGMENTKISLSGIPSGIYIMRIEFKEYQVVRKFIRP